MEINTKIRTKDPQRAPPLRPYQADALRRMKSYEGQAALSVIATGLGKTRIYTDYARWDVTENDHRILMLAHREELVKQPLDYLTDIPCGIELGPLHSNGEPIICASVQSLVGRLENSIPTASTPSLSTRLIIVPRPPTAKFSIISTTLSASALQPRQSAVTASVWT